MTRVRLSVSRITFCFRDDKFAEQHKTTRKESEVKKATLVFGIVIMALAALLISACSQGGRNTNSTVNNRASESPQRTGGMDQMMKDPAMKRQMMDQMMNDPEMMRQMMTDPKMVDMMTRYMNEHADEMNTHMQLMMNNADHRRAMIEMLRRNPQMREQMKQIISEAEKPGGPTPKASR